MSMENLTNVSTALRVTANIANTVSNIAAIENRSKFVRVGLQTS
jgi:hypothetical protein